MQNQPTNAPYHNLPAALQAALKTRKFMPQDPLRAATEDADAERDFDRGDGTLFNPLPARTEAPLRTGFTVALAQMLSVPRQDTTLIKAEHLLCALLLGLIFTIRITNLNFNTLHLDEAIYTTVGEEVRAGVYKQGASSWMFGSYLYPVVASLANQIGGVMALRGLSAVLSTITALFVYLAALRMFGTQAAVVALLVFGLTGVSINVGQHATYDSLGIPLLAISMYCAASAIMRPEKQKPYLRWAGVAFSFSVLAKYNALLLLPALVAVMLVLHLAKGRGIWSFVTKLSWSNAITPMLIILGIYAAYYRDDLRQITAADGAIQIEQRGEILRQIAEQIGLQIVFAVAALVLLARRANKQFGVTQRGILILFTLSLPLLLVTVLAMPLYHLLSANIRSMWKHDTYALVLLAPLVGYSIAELARVVRSTNWRAPGSLRIAGALLTAVCLFWFVSAGFRQNEAFHHAWMNSEPAIDFLHQQNVDGDSRILSSGYAIYDYYFNLGVSDQDVWNNIWYTEYGDLSGTEGVEAGIEDCIFDFVVLDNYWAPEYSGELVARVEERGYAIVFSTVEQISTGDEITTSVYQPPADGSCREESAS